MMDYTIFTNFLCMVINSTGVDSSLYTRDSLRRGGAAVAFHRATGSRACAKSKLRGLFVLAPHTLK